MHNGVGLSSQGTWMGADFYGGYNYNESIGIRSRASGANISYAGYFDNFSSSGTSYGIYSMVTNTSGYAGYFHGRVFSDSTMTADNFILSSDKRLKSNIKILRDTKWTDNLVYRSFTMKDDFTNRLRTGFVAQEIEKLAPQFVYTDEKGLKSLDYNGIIINVISRQRDQIEDLEARIEKLEKLLNK
jgi:hypothetical protein